MFLLSSSWDNHCYFSRCNSLNRFYLKSCCWTCKSCLLTRVIIVYLFHEEHMKMEGIDFCLKSLISHDLNIFRAFSFLVIQLRIEVHFGFCTFWMKFCNILKYGMNLKFEFIVQIFWKKIQLNTVIILKSTNEYYRKMISKYGHNMNLYPAMTYARMSHFPLIRKKIHKNYGTIEFFL